MKRLISIGLILLIMISDGLIFDYSAPETASASVIDKIELIDQRTRTGKTYWLGETPEGNQRYALDATIGSLHYKEGGKWFEIDSSIKPSNKSNWDWEVVKGHWQLLIKDDTSVAVGKDGHWLGFRYEGFAYLDKSTNEYVILDNRRAVTPVVENNKIRWEGIFYGVNLEYVYGNDRFKENLKITQEARNWLSANPPSSYGLNNQTTYLVGYIQCDWRYSYKAKAGDEPIDWEQANELEGQIDFWHPIESRIVSALPVDYAYHLTDLEFEPLKLRKRFIRAPDNNYYLLFGASVIDLNQFPAGTIVFDPTIDEQVGAAADDVSLKYSSSSISTSDTDAYYGQYNPTNWGYGFAARFQTVSINNSATIDIAYLTLEATDTLSGTTAYARITAEDVDDAADFTGVSWADFLTRHSNNTTAVDWDNIGAQVANNSYNSTSIVTPVQEVVNRVGWASGNDIVIFCDDFSNRSDSGAYRRAKLYNSGDHTHGPILHVEWSAVGGVSAPTVATYNATSVEETTATLTGNITATGGENATDRGFYWDVDSGNPYSSNWFEQGNFGVGQFTRAITSLTEGELYYSIASANNSGGTGNGTEVTFLTKPNEPTAFTATSQNSTSVNFTWSNGTGRDTTLLRYNGTGYPADPASGNLSYNGTAEAHSVTGLNPGTQIWAHIRSWCAEGGLEQYSDLTDNVTDYTLPGNPSGMVAENLTATSIDVRWTKGTGGDYSMVRRKVGSYPTGVSDGDQAYYNTGSDFSDSGLSKGTSYYYRAWARDTDSNYYSASYTQATATTNITAPTVTNASGATSISDTSAQLNGEITDNGGNTTTAVIFWGSTDGTDNASAWDNWEDRGVQAGAFSFTTSNLTALTQYFYRSRATNSEGTDWADTTANFTTLAFVEEVVIPTGTTATVAIPSIQIWLYLIAFTITGLAYWHGDNLLYILAGLGLIAIGFIAWATSYYISILLVVWGMWNFIKGSVARRAL